jgi:hypothetical protein
MTSPKRPSALGAAAFKPPPRRPGNGGALAAMEDVDEPEVPVASAPAPPESRAEEEVERSPAAPSAAATPADRASPRSARRERPESRAGRAEDRVAARITSQVSFGHLQMIRRASYWGRQSQRAFLEGAIEKQAAKIAAQEEIGWPLPPTPDEPES